MEPLVGLAPSVCIRPQHEFTKLALWLLRHGGGLESGALMWNCTTNLRLRRAACRTDYTLRAKKKSEGRIPKPEGKPKLEGGKHEMANSGFGLGISFGFRPSDFGFPKWHPWPDSHRLARVGLKIRLRELLCIHGQKKWSDGV